MPKFSRLAYEHLIYTLPQQYPEVVSSSLHLFTTAATTGLVKGSVWFHNGLELRVRELASTFPHHRHEPPDIKHNRKPAPGISYQSPNLPTLITDCIALGETLVNP